MYGQLVRNICTWGNDFGYQFDTLVTLKYICDVSNDKDKSFGAKLNPFIYFLITTCQQLNLIKELVVGINANHRGMQLLSKRLYVKYKLRYVAWCVTIVTEAMNVSDQLHKDDANEVAN